MRATIHGMYFMVCSPPLRKSKTSSSCGLDHRFKAHPSGFRPKGMAGAGGSSILPARFRSVQSGLARQLAEAL